MECHPPTVPRLAERRPHHARSHSLPEIDGTGDLFPTDPAFFPNLTTPGNFTAAQWVTIQSRDSRARMEVSRSSYSDLRPTSSVLIAAGAKELCCEFSISTGGEPASPDELRHIHAGILSAMSHLHKVALVMCTNSVVQTVLSNINRASPLESMTLLHCDHPDHAPRVVNTLPSVKGRLLVNSGLEVCVV